MPTATWNSRSGLNKLPKFLENHNSINNYDVDDSKEILEDLKELFEGLNVSGRDEELEVEDTYIVMIEHECSIKYTYYRNV